MPMRQSSTDPPFLKFLNLIRKNDYTSDNGYALRYIARKKRLYHEIPRQALRLFTGNEFVNRYNDHRCVYGVEGAQIHVNIFDVRPARVLDDICLIQYLKVKIGIPVSLIHNMQVDNGWVNGAHCTIVGYDREQDTLQLQLTNDQATLTLKRITLVVYRTHYTRIQCPIKIAFASTTQKVQSMSITGGVAVSAATLFQSPGQFYVACSRVTNSRNSFFFLVLMFQTALILTNIFPLLNRNNAADDRQIFLDKYNVSSYDYMSPAEVQGLRVQDLIRGLNRTACQAFMDVLDVIRRNVCFGHW
ncbi:unnamed protein product [Mucor circinelloides]